MKNLSKFISIVSVSILFPVVTFAQSGLSGVGSGVSNITAGATTCYASGISNLICQAQKILNSVIPVLIALGVVYFVWGVVRYVIADGEEAKKRGRDSMIYGIIGLAVIVGLWGLVNIVVNTFGLGGQVPQSVSNLVVTPGSSSSCTAINGTSKFPDVLNYITCVINQSVIPFIFAIAVVSFVWGAVKFFIINSDEEAKREQGKQFMIWGIIAMAIMISIWGLVNIVAGTFGSKTSVLPQVHPPTGQ